MPRSQNEPSKPVVVNQPSRPDCAAPMCLTEIVPEKEGYDRRTFACSKCNHSESVVVKFWG
jgi:hypothetical protein